MSQIITKITAADLQMLKELEKNSTQVVGWYANGHTVRGPFNRWFRVSKVNPIYEKNVGRMEDDVRYAAAAMNYLPSLVKRIEELEALLAVENMLRDNE